MHTMQKLHLCVQVSWRVLGHLRETLKETRVQLISDSRATRGNPPHKLYFVGELYHTYVCHVTCKKLQG